jgi:peptide chain release factor 2
MEENSFWEDAESAEEVIKLCNSLKKWTEPYEQIKLRFDSIKDILPEATETKDESLLLEIDQEIDRLDKEIEALEIKKMLSKEMDDKSCYFSINAGAGGTEACDWVSMLARMYERWATKKGWKVSIVDRLEGEIAGIKSITFKFEGDSAYGYAKAEKGVHRLVRISPFDANAKRHTSFASVDASPIIDEDIQIQVDPQDLRIDTYRSSGAGGQHVNTTDSAVRITHIPTGIVVASQGERSQLQNKETCMKMLKSKLYEKEVEERQKTLQQMGGEKKEIAWGSQIRNYVFQPYTLVKDTRTKVEVGNIQSVMDGDIDIFVNAYLKEFG